MLRIITQSYCYCYIDTFYPPLVIHWINIFNLIIAATMNLPEDTEISSVDVSDVREDNDDYILLYC